MATLDEVVGAIGEVADAINVLEANLTEALKGKLTPEDQAKVDAAFAAAKAAAADALDGVDEAVVVEPPVVPAP